LPPSDPVEAPEVTNIEGGDVPNGDAPVEEQVAVQAEPGELH